MAVDRRGREMRRHISQIEARRELKRDQGKRRRKDNMVAGVAAAATLALAVVLQLLWFSTDPTGAQVEALEEAPGVVETAEPTANSSNIRTLPSPRGGCSRASWPPVPAISASASTGTLLRRPWQCFPLLPRRDSSRTRPVTG